MPGDEGRTRSHDHNDDELSDRRLADLLGEYFDLIAAGETVDLDEFLERHPRGGPELVNELLTAEQVGSMVGVGGEFPDISDFRILEITGIGGMGIVYKAVQISLDRIVALKVLKPTLVPDVRAVARFYREARAAARLEHRDIVKIHARGVSAAGVPYFAMEFVDGETLQNLLDRLRAPEANGHSIRSSDLTRILLAIESGDGSSASSTAARNDGPVQVRDAVDRASCLRLAEAFADVAEALECAHSCGVFHRDLKPSNLILDRNGRLRILDFGLAWIADPDQRDPEQKLTLDDERPGTLSYMPPEQARGRRDLTGPTLDVYSLGATLYEMLTWKRPIEGANRQETYQKILDSEPRPPRRLNPHVPGDLQTIVLKCLEKEPRRRYGTTEALAQELRRVVRGDPIVARPQPWYELVARRIWRARRRIAEVTLLFAVIISLAYFLVYLPWYRKHERDRTLYDEYVGKAFPRLIERRMLSPVAGMRTVDGYRVLVRDDARGEIVRRGGGFMQFPAIFEVVMQAESYLFEAGSMVDEIGPDPVQTAIGYLSEAIEILPDESIAHYYLAWAWSLKGDPKKAEDELREALSSDPQFLPALSLMASILANEKSPSAERREVEERLKSLSGVGAWAADWLEAQKATLNHDWGTAADAWSGIVQSAEKEEKYQGATLETLVGAAVAHLNAGDLLSAADYLEQSTGEWKRGIELSLILGKLDLLVGDSRHVKRANRRFHLLAGRKRPLSDGDLHAIAATYAGVGEYESAVEWVRRMSPGVERIRLEAELLCKRQKADEAARITEDLDRKIYENVLTLGNVRMAQDRLGEAADLYRKAKAIGPTDDPRPLLALAVCLEIAGEAGEAEETFRQAVDSHEDHWQCHYNLANFLSRRDRLGEARAQYREAIRDGGGALALNNLGTVLDRLGDPDAAMEQYAQATRLAPLFGLAHYNLAWAFHRQQRFGEAVEEYRRAEAFGMRDRPELHRNQAQCLQCKRDYRGAFEEYDKAIRLDDKDALTYQSRGILHEWMGSLESARGDYEEALELEKDWAGVQNSLAGVLGRLGLLKLAVDRYYLALELDPRLVWAYNGLATLWLLTGHAVTTREEREAEIELLEAGASLMGMSSSVPWLLEKHRLEFLPDLASYASIDWRVDGPEVVIPEGGEWRSHKGESRPSTGLEWTEQGFDDAGWKSGRSPLGFGSFGFPDTVSVETRLDDMPGRYSTLYLRHRFQIADPMRIRELVLSIRVDDGFVAYLNGQEVARFRAGKAGSSLPHDATAEEHESLPWMAFEFRIPPVHVKSGENVLAVQGLNSYLDDSDFVLSPVLKAVPVLDGERIDRLQASLEAFAAVAAGEDAPSRLAYFKARLLEARGKLVAAEERFRAVAAAASGRPEPVFRIASCLRARGHAPAAEKLLREELGSDLRSFDLVWDAWLDLSLVALDRAPQQILGDFPRLVNGADSHGRPADLRWLLERLSDGKPIRIVAAAGRDYKTWSRDRFYSGGQPNYLRDIHARLQAAQPDVDHGPLYQTERYYSDGGPRVSGYRIPLPSGRYRVTLHFIEGWHEGCDQEGGARRVFDVLLEGETIRECYDPCENGFAVPQQMLRDVAIDDGALDIDFVRREDTPNISAIEVEMIETGDP